MKQCITLKKLGGFYNVYNDDTYILYYLFHYKINNNKSGFPVSAYHKVINKLEEKQISYFVEEKEDKKDFKKKNRYVFFLNKGKKKVEREYKASHIMEEIKKLKETELDELLTIIENYVIK